MQKDQLKNMKSAACSSFCSGVCVCSRKRREGGEGGIRLDGASGRVLQAAQMKRQAPHGHGRQGGSSLHAFALLAHTLTLLC